MSKHWNFIFLLQSTDHGVIYLAALLMSFFVLLICVVIILICKMKAWTTKTPDLPSLLVKCSTKMCKIIMIRKVDLSFFYRIHFTCCLIPKVKHLIILWSCAISWDESLSATTISNLRYFANRETNAQKKHNYLIVPFDRGIMIMYSFLILLALCW